MVFVVALAGIVIYYPPIYRVSYHSDKLSVYVCMYVYMYACRHSYTYVHACMYVYVRI